MTREARKRRRPKRRRSLIPDWIPEELRPQLSKVSEALREQASTAADLAEKDPEAFKKECRRLADSFGLSVEQAYQVVMRVKGDPTVRKSLGNRLINLGARFVRNRFGI